MMMHEKTVVRLLVCASLFLVVNAPDDPALARTAPRLLPLQAVKAVAAKEGLAITSVYAEAPRRLIVLCKGPMDRALFLKRASLVAFAAFQSWAAPVEVVFEHTHDHVIQRCRIRHSDLHAYLKDQITRDEYDRRIAYRRERPEEIPSPPENFTVTRETPGTPAPTVAAAEEQPSPPVVSRAPSPVQGGTLRPRISSKIEPENVALKQDVPGVLRESPPGLSDLPEVGSSEASSGPSPDTAGRLETSRPDRNSKPSFFTTPAPSTPAAATVVSETSSLPRQFPGEWRASYGMALGGSFFDMLSLEYGRTLLPTLDLRPSIWMIGGLAPKTLFTRSVDSLDGVSLAFDLLATGHRTQSGEDINFEGGVGVRAAVLQGATSGLWPATHLRVGGRWRSLSLGLRYPLLARPGDPTAIWDLSIGYHWAPASSSQRP
ncbi:MAG: hypothetical protein VKN33_02630 [Candidatus Sericytochromatia bacterium]|nr:hypothetical protein [Candidatus Sericytochromatia bacterium]